MAKKWESELSRLEAVLDQMKLNRTIKWGTPVYTHNGKNVVGIAGFKSYFGLWFYNGVFLKDESNKLVNANEEKTKSLRQWRFYSSDEIDESLILKYVKEAIEIEEKGLKIKPEKKSVEIPELLKKEFVKDKNLKSNFDSFTPYKQREFCEFISSAKRESTQVKRLSKVVHLISEGIGLNDKYK